jgi:hypothetical protein
MGKYFTPMLLRYFTSMVATMIATKLGLDASQTGALNDWIMTGVVGLIAFGPPAWRLLFGPSEAAQEVAREADKIIGGDKKEATITTPANVPNIKVEVARTRGGQG